jgi:hypothetical protein
MQRITGEVSTISPMELKRIIKILGITGSR